MDKFNIGQIVKLHTDDEWNGMYGIIQNSDENGCEVFAVPIPYFIYYVDIDMADKVLENVSG